MDPSIWPSELWEVNAHDGFEDLILEKLVTGKFGFSEGMVIPSPVIFWPMELYSFGKCFRQWLNWPKFIPLPAYGDHGVHLSRRLDELELSAPTKLHLTWSNWRKAQKIEKKRIIQIEHPWVTYRNRCSIEKDKNARGTLVYLTHSLPGADFATYDFETYFETLLKLPREYHPIVLSMPMHDLRKNLHRTLSKFEIPMVTAGNTSSPFFVDRFYDLARQFKFATSNAPGSALFYCHELGLESFILGDAPADVLNAPKKLVGNDLDLEEMANFCFSSQAHGQIRDEFVRNALGIGKSTEEIRKIVRKKLILELIRLSPIIISRGLKAGISVLLKVRGINASTK